MSGRRIRREHRNLRWGAPATQAMRAGAVGLAAVVLFATPIAARHDATVQERLPSCYAAIEDNATVADRIDGAGRCTGIVEALLYIGELLSEDLRFCVPKSLRDYEAVRHIVKEIEQDYTTLESRNFKATAMAIMRRLWPCAAPKR